MSRYNSTTQRWVKRLLPQSRKAPYQNKVDQKNIELWKRDGRGTPPPHAVKVRTVSKFQVRTGFKVLVESGTFMGDMILSQLDNFDSIYSIELNKKFWEDAKTLFRNESKVNLLRGDSGVVMHSLIDQLDESAIFWLDGHYSGGETSMGDKACPIYEELSAIFKSQQSNCLLIDDARLFVGKDDYPTLLELKDYILKNRPNAVIEIDADTISVLY